MTAKPRNPNRVIIFDTTLRDGEQSPGCSMTQPEKLRVARALAELGVDVIEAGFPAASRGDWEAVREIARTVRGPVIAGLARCNREDIDKAWSAVREAARPRLHVFLATSAIHREHKLNMAKEQIIQHGRGRREVRSQPLRRRGVLARGRVAHRARVPARSGRGRDRRRRHDHQRARHGRLYRARGIPRGLRATC